VENDKIHSHNHFCIGPSWQNCIAGTGPKHDLLTQSMATCVSSQVMNQYMERILPATLDQEGLFLTPLCHSPSKFPTFAVSKQRVFQKEFHHACEKDGRRSVCL